MLRESEDIRIQEGITELAMRIVGAQQFSKLWQLLVERLQSCWRHRKQLAPMRAGVEWRELFFDQREQLTDCGPIFLPGKVERDRCLLVACTHPQRVGGDSAYLGNLQERGHMFA